MLTGVGRAVDMVMTTRLIGADEALAVGLVNELFDTPEALMARAHALADQIATQAPLTMRATKEIVRRMRARFAGIEDRDLIGCATAAPTSAKASTPSSPSAPRSSRGASSSLRRMHGAATPGPARDPLAHLLRRLRDAWMPADKRRDDTEL